MYARHCFALFCAVLLSDAQPNDATLVRVETGLARGVVSGRVASWKGIPYAEPPIGNLRWRAPRPAKPWQGVRNGQQFGAACMQVDDVPKSEDCLTLNVWRPSSAGTKALPVMVWIHGGAMVHGSAAIYPADAVAAQGVVVVSMNYRLGRLGHFAHPALAAEAPGDVRGNYGYLDQLAALQWVRRNIVAFGGDPQQITLFGESAGGGSVMAHLISPMSRGLFQRAILQSPGAPGARAQTSPSADLATAEKMALDWARSAGIEGAGAAALRQLRDLPAAKLVEGTSGIETLAALSAGTKPFGMAMSILDGRFLLEQPESALAAGRQAMVPVMIGADDHELAIGSAGNKDELFAYFGPDSGDARRVYDPRGEETLAELKQEVFADRVLVEPARHFADEMARAGQPVWLYRFAYVAESQRGRIPGCLHGLEIPFTFDLPGALVGDKVTAADKIMGDLASAYWVQFGKTGNPNGDGRLLWPRYDPGVDRIFHFTNSGVIVGTDPLKARLDLWQKVWTRGSATTAVGGQ